MWRLCTSKAMEVHEGRCNPDRITTFQKVMEPYLLIFIFMFYFITEETVGMFYPRQRRVMFQ